MSNSRRLARLAKLGRLTGQVTSSVIGGRVGDVLRSKDERQRIREKLTLENAERLVDGMSKMKGAAMKLGQSAALVASSLGLPDEVNERLASLHSQGEPVPFPAIERAVAHSLEAPLSELFLEFDREPIGSASLGQAHRAVLHDGTEVVVKVLHEGIEADVESDLLALRTILLGTRALRRPGEEVQAVFQEIKDRLLEELDYMQEAANMVEMREALAGWDDITVPRVHGRLSTDRVLTMDRLPGVHLAQFKLSAPQAAKDRAAGIVAELYYRSTFRHRMLHADPHPGNYLFTPDGRVGLLDFGCVKRFQDEFWLGNYAKGAGAAIDGDRALYLAMCRRIGCFVGDDPEGEQALWEYGDTLAEPFRRGVTTLGGKDDPLPQRVKEVTGRIFRYPSIRIPAEIVFLQRALGGLYAMGLELRATQDWGAIARPHAQAAVDRAEGRGTT